MVKNKGGGLPYLQTSLKFDFNSSTDMSEELKEKFLNDLKDLLSKHTGTLSLCPPNDAKEGHQISTDILSIGLDPVFENTGNGAARCALFDSEIVKSLGPSNVVGLFIEGSPITKAFVVEGLAKMLASLKIVADAVATTENADELNDFILSSPLKEVARITFSPGQMSSSSNSDSRKRNIPSSDSDSDDDDYYSKMVDRAIDSDDDIDPIASSSSPDRPISSIDDLLILSDDEDLELSRSRNFEEQLKESARNAQLEREKRYKQELDEVARHGVVKEAQLGAQPRNIHVLSVYEDSMKQLKEVNDAVEQLITNKDDLVYIEEELQEEPDDLKFTIKMLDDDKQPNLKISWPLGIRMHNFFEEISKRLDTSVDTVKLYHNNQKVDKWQKPVDLKMTGGHTYFLDCMTIGTSTRKNPTIKCQMASRRPILLTVKPKTTFGEIRKMLVEKGAPPFKKLIFDDTVISDDKTLQQLGMEHNDVVDAM